MQRTSVRAKPHDLEELDQPKLFEATTQDTAGRHKRILIRREPDVLDTSPTRMPPRTSACCRIAPQRVDIGNAPRRTLLGESKCPHVGLPTAQLYPGLPGITRGRYAARPLLPRRSAAPPSRRPASGAARPARSQPAGRA